LAQRNILKHKRVFSIFRLMENKFTAIEMRWRVGDNAMSRNY